jgi:hypothetical protein
VLRRLWFTGFALVSCTVPRPALSPAPHSGCWAVAYEQWSVPFADTIASRAPQAVWLDTAIAYDNLHVAKNPADTLWAVWRVDRNGEGIRIMVSVPASPVWNYLFSLAPRVDSLMGAVRVTDADLDMPDRMPIHMLARSRVTLRRSDSCDA